MQKTSSSELKRKSILVVCKVFSKQGKYICDNSFLLEFIEDMFRIKKHYYSLLTQYSLLKHAPIKQLYFDVVIRSLAAGNSNAVLYKQTSLLFKINL